MPPAAGSDSFCLEPRPADLNDSALDWRQEPFAPSHLDGVGLVLAAATPEINTHVATLARSRGLWVNVASGDARGDLQLASVVRRGDLLVAIGTHGAAPALSRRLREHLEETLPPELTDWLTLLAELRPQILATLPDEPRRRALIDQLTAWSWLDRIRSEGVEAVRAAMHAELARAATHPWPGSPGAIH
ncbi:MAG: NAD(P)-dependent oxidoreductase [Gemmataceae bacterium]